MTAIRVFLGSSLALGGLLCAGHDAPAAEGGPSRAAMGVMPATAGHVGAHLSDVAREQDQVQRRLDALVEESKTVQSLLVAHGRAYVRMARAGLLPIGGGFDELVDHAARLERMHRALARNVERESAIARERIALSQRLRILGERRGLLEDERAALERSHAAIEAAAEREQAFQRAFMGGSASDHSAVYAAGVGNLAPEELSAGFESMRGRLPFPLLGRAEIHPSRRPGTSEKGLEMRAAAGAPVTAVYPGRVAFADEYADYGRTVILDHGSGYFTVTAGFGTVDVKAGDAVGQGQRLGVLPNGSGSLYFEVRRNGDVVEAGPWFGL